MTNIQKNMRGLWEARTVKVLPNNRQLTILTMKRHNGELVTNATVATIKGDFVEHRMFTDFNETLQRVVKRCTAKAVEAEHNRVLAMKLEEVLVAVENHYKA